MCVRTLDPFPYPAGNETVGEGVLLCPVRAGPAVLNLLVPPLLRKGIL